MRTHGRTQSVPFLIMLNEMMILPEEESVLCHRVAIAEQVSDECVAGTERPLHKGGGHQEQYKQQQEQQELEGNVFLGEADCDDDCDSDGDCDKIKLSVDIGHPERPSSADADSDVGADGEPI
ncbi:hypothetical protein M5D96_002403 [Drosophila gunungcola]|uniref:Uncharacterized protein n=1 Tax=Drosophila gunungcola TaxID=103775 RepID=A0A9P9YZV3_9MUSC|nr:hypothetical protein M5D96_002403 [Drosophila gunungcola]